MTDPNRNARLTGGEVDQAIKDWLLTEMKQSASRCDNLFNHFFMASIGAIPTLLALYKFFMVKIYHLPPLQGYFFFHYQHLRFQQ